MTTWRNRTPFWARRVLRTGRPSIAKVVFLLQGTDGDSNPSWSEVRGELEVSIPGKGAVSLRGLFNGDRKRARFVWPGATLPVRLHAERDDKLAIDWKAWEQEGGLAAAQQQGEPSGAWSANLAIYEGAGSGAGSGTGSAPQESMSAGAASDSAGSVGWQEQSIATWKQAVASGHMTQDEFEQALADLRSAGG